MTEIDEIEDSNESAREQLQHVAALVLGLAAPARCHPGARARDRAQPRGAAAYRRAREADRGDPADHRARPAQTGELRNDFDAEFAAVFFYGGIEELLSGWVLGQIPDGDARSRPPSARSSTCSAGFQSRLSSSAKRAAPTLPPESTIPTRRRGIRAGEQRRDADGAARLDHHLHPVEEEAIASTISASLTVTISSTSRG